jgi:WD40 repeat protein
MKPTQMIAPALIMCTIGCGNLVDPGGGASQVAYSPKGEIATFVPQALLLMDGKLDRVNAQITFAEPESEVTASTWKTLSADGKVAAAARSSNSTDLMTRLTVFDVPGGQQRMAIDVQWPEAFILSADGSLLAIAAHQGDMPTPEGGRTGGDPVVEVYATATGAKLWQTPSGRASKIVFSADGSRLFAGWRTQPEVGQPIPPHRLRAWEAVTGAPVFDVDMGFENLATLSATPDGKHLVASLMLVDGLSLPDRRDGEWGFALFRTADGTLAGTVPQPAEFHNTNHLAISPDGSLWAANTHRYPLTRAQATLQVWKRDAAGNMTLLHAFDKELFSLSFSPDGQSIATVDLDHAVSVYRAADGQLLARRDFSSGLF